MSAFPLPAAPTGSLPPPAPAPRSRHTLRAGLVGGLVGAVVAGGVAYATVQLTDDNGAAVAANKPAASVLNLPGAVAGNFDVHAVLDKIGNAVVAIEVGTQRGNNIFNNGAGSGFIVSSDGFVLTNNHVVDGSNAITVKFADGTTEKATVVGTSAQHDVAVLKINNIHGATPLKLADTSSLRVGDDVLAIGNALDLGDSPTVTLGIVSAKGRSIDTQSETGAAEHLTGLIQTDAAINPGNSGGPLVNAAGEVVGINSAGVQGANNIGFAIDINSVKDIITQLEQGKNVDASAPFLGVATVAVSDLDSQTRQQFDVTVNSGLLVETVSSGSGAEKAGIKEGDVITKVDGKNVKSSDDLRNAIQGKKAGDTLTIEIQRNGQTQTVTATLGSRSATNN
ncbi:MAG TPA: trypsin-like peptidase domain-containing protein [Acidimicrobiales bacterium]|nr:trypsin-like peptidase domain-containing protein [Acidimicrobiales bacterium]